MEFDPSVVSYSSLLDLFWSSHSPTSANNSRIYQKAVFTHSLEQSQLARTSLVERAKRAGKPITTTIEKPNFVLAGESDQKYYLRHSPFWSAYLKHYPQRTDITNSAAAAKANGYLGGNSNQKQFSHYAELLGLPRRQVNLLRKKVPGKARHFVPKCALPGD